MVCFFESFSCCISFSCVLEGVLSYSQVVVTSCKLSSFICSDVGYIFLIAFSCYTSFIKLLGFTF